MRHAERGRDGDLHDRAGQRDPAHRQQVVQREVQADAEHQQHHADLGELARELDVGDEAGRGRADDDAGDEVADQRRQLQPRGDEAHDQREAQGGGDGGDQADVVRHADATDSIQPRILTA